MYDVYEIRKQFPMLNGKTMQNKPLVFLDNASTTFKPQCVIDAVDEYYSKNNSNSHRGDYDLAYNMDQTVIKARKVIAEFINCSPDEVVFTSGATMALNMAAFSFAKNVLKDGDEILIEEDGHASNVLPWFEVAKQTGAVIKYVPLDEKGKVCTENVRKSLTNKTKIVSLAGATNVLGYSIDVPAIAKLVHEVGAYFIVDGAQSVPHLKTDFKGWDIDFLAFSAHKMCGPTGIGCLIGKYELLKTMKPLLLGGGMNEMFYKDGSYSLLNPPASLEAGTQNLAAVAGFMEAVKFIQNLGIDNIHQHDVELHDYAVEKLKNNDRVILYNAEANSGNIVFNIKDVFAQDESTLLNYHGIAVRSGNHCAKMLVNYIGLPYTCRASSYLYTTKEDIDALVDAINNGGDILDVYFN
ncbi:MAG: aminotransferase class V-fold PLP-dependent enzyme [Bacilli bacterium]|nr:aminotransferase class V-fold PLP-dependent enzyme [Bacilli bacterium]MBO4682728.1 aminotransferase class V-fold PLP-dependent enzyme [Bacilli bacterium]